MNKKNIILAANKTYWLDRVNRDTPTAIHTGISIADFDCIRVIRELRTSTQASYAISFTTDPTSYFMLQGNAMQLKAVSTIYFNDYVTPNRVQKFQIYKDKLIIDNNTIDYGGTTTANTELYLLSGFPKTSYNFYIYYMDTLKDGVITHTFIPCKRNGKIAFYDRIANRYYYATDGSLIAGNIVQSPNSWEGL